MKTLTFKDIKAFERRITNAPAWNDFFILGGHLYNIYEYGPGPGVSGVDYCYWLNKRTGTAVHVEYDCPSYSYKDGIKVDGKRYRLHSVELIPDFIGWR